MSDILFLSNISFALWAVVFTVSIYLIYTDTLRQTVHDKLAKSVMLDDKKLIEDKNFEETVIIKGYTNDMLKPGIEYKLYDIDFKKMNEGFTSIGIKNIESHFTLNQSHPLFLDLEMGFVNEQAFFDGFRALSNLPLSNDQITIAWNSLLVGFRKSSIEWLKENNKTYPTFLYSNTNQIHCDHFICRSTLFSNDKCFHL